MNSTTRTPCPSFSEAVDRHPVSIIAEMANAHEGRFDDAVQIVEAAATAGANAVKFQLFTADELAVPNHSNFDLYRSLEMPEDSWRRVVDRAHDRGLLVYADVFGLSSAILARQLGVDGFKIHTSDLSNTPLLKLLTRFNNPILLSVGGATWVEVAEAMATIRAESDAPQITLMHGIQGYPTAIEDSCLRKIGTLRTRFAVPVGFAAHADGGSQEAIDLPLWAVAAGADLIEIHLTLSRSNKGLDYFSSLEPEQFEDVVRRIRSMEPALGHPRLSITPAEQRYRTNHKKVVVNTRNIASGERMTEESLALKRFENPPAGALHTTDLAVGRTASRAIPSHSVIRREDMKTRVAAVLACRAESTRLFGKPLQQVGDRAILEHLIDQLQLVKSIDEIVLAIADTPSSQVFARFAERHNLHFVIGDETDVLGRLIRAAEAVDAHVIARQTTENPYIYWENLDEMIEEHIRDGADLSVTEGLPLGSWVEVISLDALRRSHRFGEDRHRSELCTLFISENKESFRVNQKVAPREVRRPNLRLTVDNPEDLIVVRRIWDALHGSNKPIPIAEIVAFTDDHPEVVAINTDFQSLRLWA